MREREREREREMGEGRVKMLIKWHVVLCNLSLFGGVVDSKKRMRLSEKQIVLFFVLFCCCLGLYQSSYFFNLINGY